MAEYGLGQFKYELTVDGDAANFKFYDPEDVTNTAETSIGAKDFPEGVNQPDSRDVAELAYAQVAGVLNDKRDARIVKTKEDELEKQTEADSNARAAAQDFFNKSNDGEVPPVKVEADGTKVYNTAPIEDKTEDKKKK